MKPLTSVPSPAHSEEIPASASPPGSPAPPPEVERVAAGQLALELMHEVRNPVETLGHLAYLALADAEDSEKVRKYMTLAEEQVGTLSTLINQALGYARISITPHPTRLHLVADAALRIHHRTIESKRVRVIKDIPEDLEASVCTGELLQVLSNLLVNALDALPEDGKICLRIHKRPGKVHLVVADNGHGIPSHHVDRIFEPFFTTKGEHGTGLGLALSRRIVERHRGRIRVRTSVRAGRSGSTFRISLPT